jgi:hypothetical protein
MTLMLELRSGIVPSFLNHLVVIYITLTGNIISPWLPSHHHSPYFSVLAGIRVVCEQPQSLQKAVTAYCFPGR